MGQAGFAAVSHDAPIRRRNGSFAGIGMTALLNRVGYSLCEDDIAIRRCNLSLLSLLPPVPFCGWLEGARRGNARSAVPTLAQVLARLRARPPELAPEERVSQRRQLPLPFPHHGLLGRGVEPLRIEEKHGWVFELTPTGQLNQKASVAPIQAMGFA
jgi:hypothetical protein